MRFAHLFLMSLMCLENVKFRSMRTPKNLKSFASLTALPLRFNLVLVVFRFLVKVTEADFSVDMVKPHSLHHNAILFRPSWTSFSTLKRSWCVAQMATSSAKSEYFT